MESYAVVAPRLSSGGRDEEVATSTIDRLPEVIEASRAPVPASFRPGQIENAAHYNECRMTERQKKQRR